MYFPSLIPVRKDPDFLFMTIHFPLDRRKHNAYLQQESVMEPFVLLVHFRLNSEVTLKIKTSYA